MPTRAADDANFISARIPELRKEERERLNADCDCPDDVREDGTTIKAHRPGCRHYLATPLPVGLALYLDSRAIQHFPAHDWERFKAAAAATTRLRRLRWL